MKAAIILEIDFAARRKRICVHCGKPFLKHFQPPDDADPKLSGNWCPNPIREDAFTSRVFKPEAGGKQQ